MFGFLHNFHPQPLLFSIGPINVYWYGLFMAAGILAALFVSYNLAKKSGLSPEYVFDAAFWVIVGGLIGARAYEVLAVSPGYYFSNPGSIVKVWEGGMAIHGALIGGVLAAFIFLSVDKRFPEKPISNKIFDLLGFFSISVPLGQAIGRWGNYFNQEIFGSPTDLPWGIPIDIMNRPAGFISAGYFHPTFLYESLGCFFIFLLLLAIYKFFYLDSGGRNCKREIVLWSLPAYYLLAYSVLRFSLEFIRLDETPTVGGWRLPQLVSFFIAIIATTFIIYLNIYHEKGRPQKEK